MHIFRFLLLDSKRIYLNSEDTMNSLISRNQILEYFTDELLNNYNYISFRSPNQLFLHSSEIMF